MIKICSKVAINEEILIELWNRYEKLHFVIFVVFMY